MSVPPRSVGSALSLEFIRITAVPAVFLHEKHGRDARDTGKFSSSLPDATGWVDRICRAGALAHRLPPGEERRWANTPTLHLSSAGLLPLFVLYRMIPA